MGHLIFVIPGQESCESKFPVFVIPGPNLAGLNLSLPLIATVDSASAHPFANCAKGWGTRLVVPTRVIFGY